MSVSAGSDGGLRRSRLVRTLQSVAAAARAQADDVLAHVPDTGDPATGRAVDDFVEQAADALRALDETVSATLRRLQGDVADQPGVPSSAHTVSRSLPGWDGEGPR